MTFSKEMLTIFDILFSRKIICFGGEWGRGKTLSATAYVYLASMLYGVRNIISNIPLNLPFEFNFIPFVETAQLDEVPFKTIILHDEMPGDLDSRNSLSPRNSFVTKFAKDLRKLESQIVGTVQYFDFIDVRMNDLLQIIIIPSFVKPHYHKNDKEDIKLRLQNKDFRMKWYIIDKKLHPTQEYNIELNLYPYLNFYDTTFIPNSLAITHRDFTQHLITSKSIKAGKMFMEQMNETINENKANLEAGMIKLRGE